MTKYELERYLFLTSEIERLEGELEDARKQKQQLAQVLYERHGKDAVYRVGEGDTAQDIMVAPTKAGTYYFAPRVRWSKDSRAAKAERKRLDRIARLQQPPIGRRGGMTHEALFTQMPATRATVDEGSGERLKAFAGERTHGQALEDAGFVRAIGGLPEHMWTEEERAAGRPLHPSERVREVLANPPSLFKSLPAAELASVPLPTQAEIEVALEKGRSDAEAIRKAPRGHPLPMAPHRAMAQIALEELQAEEDEHAMAWIRASGQLEPGEELFESTLSPGVFLKRRITPRRVEITATLTRKSSDGIESDFDALGVAPLASPNETAGAGGDISHSVAEESHCSELTKVLDQSSSVPTPALPSGGVGPSHDPSPGIEMSHTPATPKTTGKRNLPIVADVNTPKVVEPRLLQIQEPSDPHVAEGPTFGSKQNELETPEDPELAALLEALEG